MDDKATYGMPGWAGDHYAEPWAAALDPERSDGSCLIVDSTGQVVVEFSGGALMTEDEPALARRIAACVNACHGLATEDLERFTRPAVPRSEDSPEVVQ